MRTPQMSDHARERCAEMGISTKVAKRIVQHADATWTDRGRVLAVSDRHPGVHGGVRDGGGAAGGVHGVVPGAAGLCEGRSRVRHMLSHGTLEVRGERLPGSEVLRCGTTTSSPSSSASSASGGHAVTRWAGAGRSDDRV